MSFWSSLIKIRIESGVYCIWVYITVVVKVNILWEGKVVVAVILVSAVATLSEVTASTGITVCD